ncbi:response regulator transcription factor [Halomonas cerina]|uniref:LuxR family transcriptional regulator of csgAB operon n=1 Tax=Halomonas cerina TaxID=447424 RepID=A0A839V7W9_9GAMM|nr:response regulator transcription factor [Halomonas cerina]MBB3190080.1 LuxR family transcriptional regulator of csgAB operon [Halomonas cerina]
MKHPQGLILLVTELNAQSQLFADYLRQKLGCSVQSIAPEGEWTGANESPVVILLDADHLDDSTLQAWQEHGHDDENTCIAVFNLADEDRAVEILAAMNIQGIFYRSESLELLCKGLKTLMQGQLWMSRPLMARMLRLFRRQQLHSYRPICGLTPREMEIIAMLSTGISNSEIAARLSVSEHTVKSHLYNIFRKIKVHNRLQAVNWARQNLVPPPPLAGSTADQDINKEQ